MKQQKWVTLTGIALLISGVSPLGVLADSATTSSSVSTTTTTATPETTTSTATATNGTTTLSPATTTTSTKNATTSATATTSSTAATTSSESPTTATPTTVADGTYTIGYTTKKTDSDDASTMSKYLSTPAHVKVENGTYRIAVTFTGPTAYNLQLWTYDAAGTKQKPTVLSQKAAGANTVSVYEFTVPNLTDAYTANITYTVAGVYKGNHDFRMVFDKSSLTADDQYPVATTATTTTTTTAATTSSSDLAANKTTQKTVVAAATPNKAVSSADFTVVQPDGKTTSMMNSYVNKPLYLVKEAKGYTAYLTVNNASWYKSFKIKVGDTYVEATKVADNDQNDSTEVYRFQISDPNEQIPAKVHIVVPAIQYDNEYDVQLKIDAASLKDVTTSKPAYVDNLADKTETSDPAKTNDPEKTTPSTTNSSNTSSKKTANNSPKTPLTWEKASYVTGKFTVYENGTNQTAVSMMNQYVNNPFYAKKTATGYMVYLTVNHASWYQSFQVMSAGKYLDATKVADTDRNPETQVYRFPVKNLTALLPAQVHILVPTIQYDHTYKVDIRMDPSSIKASTTVPSYVTNDRVDDSGKSGKTPAKKLDKPTGLANVAYTALPVASSSLTNTQAIKNPKTGVDQTMVWLYGSVFLVSALGFFAVAKRRL